MISDKWKKFINVLVMALGIGILPPIWAVISSYIGVKVGSVALICAGVYVANGDNPADAVKISIGFIMGDIWAYIATYIMSAYGTLINPNLLLYLVLFILGITATFLGCYLERICYLPSWLGGWAIGLTVLNSGINANTESLFVQIAVAMLVGVWYVGVILGVIQRFVVSKIIKK